MRKAALLAVVAVIALLMTSGSLLAGGNGSQGPKGPQGGPGGGYEALDGTEAANLLHMREEEKLARDVYLLLADFWDSTVFSNIAASEQQHMDTLGKLIVEYGQDDPVGDNGPGVFLNEELGNLYVELTEAGKVSYVQALKVGATIEDMDIFDLNEALAAVSGNEDLQTAYINLTKGSRNHLRSFFGALEDLGETYTPVFICEELFEAIVTSDPESVHYTIDDAPDYPDCLVE